MGKKHVKNFVKIDGECLKTGALRSKRGLLLSDSEGAWQCMSQLHTGEVCGAASPPLTVKFSAQV